MDQPYTKLDRMLLIVLGGKLFEVRHQRPAAWSDIYWRIEPALKMYDVTHRFTPLGPGRSYSRGLYLPR